MEEDFAGILGRRLPSVDIQTMKDVTSWIPTLAPFDSRFGIYAAKWARPVAGTAKDAIERGRRDGPDYVPPTPREIEVKLVSVRKALSKLEEMPSDPRTVPFILGARLAIRHAEVIAAELDGRDPGRFPEKETERFFGLEQSASSAAVSSSLVWASLAWEGCRTP